ncbi:DegT/DnrJ/EryC1/StrS family aminotransferase [Flexivirga meconopsidis]|uniref:DegT/DnrJ/EryC1/StrS family aminotransferase n=1 Tax=Flexivirga meconopsidis TaxID=2977121 RepID=UPI0022406084|nr:DegT/DnrJ/EryC1/StrS family aminotransferase [Flexivirga meconopsidis]
MSVIPFFTGARSIERDWPNLEQRLTEVIARGQFTYGAVGMELERAVERFTGARHAIAVANGSDAIVILLRAVGIGPGDEVIVPAYTFFSTASSVALVGAEPVMVDVVSGSYAMDPGAARAAIGPRTKAIMPVHLFSQMADMAPLRALAAEHGLLLLEDSAEGIGMFQGGRHAGLHGAGGVLSFFPTKTLGGLGDGGMLLTDDHAVATAARRLRAHGAQAENPDEYVELGYNSRLDELQAAVLLTRLEHLPADIAHRAALAAHYDRRLAGLMPAVRTPRLLPTSEPGTQVCYVYLIEARDRDRLVDHLAEHGIGTETYYPVPVHRQPAFAGRIGTRFPCPTAESASERAVALPMYADLAHADVDYVCDVILDFYREGP